MSLICDIIKDHKRDWKEYIEDKYPDIGFKCSERDPSLFIFKYGIGANFKDPVVCEARGIIIDVSVPKVVCFPFTKFGEYGKSYVNLNNINWKNAHIEDKKDGSLITLWWNEHMERWNFSTSGNIFAEDTLANLDNKISFEDVIESADNYDDLENAMYDGTLEKNKTYIFELTSPVNKVVINYDETTLWHIGTRNNTTEKESDDDIGIHKVFKYKVSSIDEALEFADALNRDIADSKIHGCTDEGYVVCDDNFNRVKVKSPIYLSIHNLINGGKQAKELLMKYIINNDLDISDLCNDKPDKAVYFSYYFHKYTEIKWECTNLLNLCRKLYSMNGNDNKHIASIISGTKYQKIIFKGLNNDLSFDEIIKNMKRTPEKVILSMIDDYDSSIEKSAYGIISRTIRLEIMKYPYRPM